MTNRTNKRFMHAVCVAGLLVAGTAWAGGGDEESGGDFATEGPSYFGFVRDHRGATVPGARVVLRGKTGAPVEVKTNMMGMYRTHIRKDVKPEEVVMVCEKPGYKQTRAQRRQHPGTSNNNIEIDCMMQKG